MQTILVIDDDDAVRNAILLGLKTEGLRGLPGKNGREGMELAKKRGVDLILCDLNLGGTDASGTFKALRDHAFRNGIPFIVMTGQPDQAGEGDDVLVKPFTLTALLETIQRHLAQQPVQQAEKRLSQKGKRPAGKTTAPDRTDRAERLASGRSTEQLEEILARVQALREEERKQLARLIHDDLTQTLTVVAIELSLLESNLGSSPKGTASNHTLTVKRLTGLVNDLIRSAQEITARLHPKVLDEFGLMAALEWLSGQAEHKLGLKCELLAEGEESALDPHFSAGLFRICEEVLSNAAKHAGASAASILVTRRADHLSIEIHHDGELLEPGAAAGAGQLELLAVRKKAEWLGGQFSLHQVRGESLSTRVVIQVQL